MKHHDIQLKRTHNETHVDNNHNQNHNNTLDKNASNTNNDYHQISPYLSPWCWCRFPQKNQAPMISEPPNLRSAAAETGPPVGNMPSWRQEGPVWSCPKEGVSQIETDGFWMFLGFLHFKKPPFPYEISRQSQLLMLGTKIGCRLFGGPIVLQCFVQFSTK